MKFLKEHLDLFWEPINFFYKKASYHKSICGGVTSLIIIIISIGYLAFLLWDMVFRSLPIMHTILHVNPKPDPIQIIYNPSISLNKDQIPSELQSNTTLWPISIGIRRNLGSSSPLLTLDPDYININIEEISFKNSVKKSRNIKYQLCDDPNFFGDSHVYKQLNLNKTYCIKEDYLLQGFQGTENSNWLQVTFSICKGKPTCKSYSEIQTYLEALQFELYYIDSAIDLQNENNTYVKRDVMQQYWDVHPKFCKYSRMHLSIDTINNYMNWIPDYLSFSYTTEYFLTMKNVETQLTDYDEDNGNLLIFVIFSTNQTTQWEKRSTDAFYQISLFGGLFPLLFLIGYIFVSATAKYKLKESLVNDFYKIIPSEKEKMAFIKYLAYIYKQNYLKEMRSKSLNSSFKNEVKLQIPEKEKLNEDENNQNIYKRKETSAEELLDSEHLEKSDTLKEMGKHSSKNNEETDLKNFLNTEMMKHLMALNEKELQEIIENHLNYNQQSKDELALVLAKSRKKYMFHSVETIYEKAMDSVQKGLRFVSYEIFLKICCRCCFHTQRVKDRHSLVKNFEIFDYADKKLAREFDIIYVLQTMSQFKNFIKVYFNETQISLFNYVQKPVLKHNDDLDEEESASNIQTFYESVSSILNKESYDYKLIDNQLLINLGISQNDINNMRMEYAEKNFIPKNKNENIEKDNEDYFDMPEINESKTERKVNKSIELAIRDFEKDELNKVLNKK
jgi:hypothetical protein